MVSFESLLLLLLAGGVLAPRVVGWGEQHGEEEQQRHQQVGDIYGDEQPAVLRRLRTSQRFARKLIEKDVTQDGQQRGGNMGGVQDGGSPDPPAATWGGKESGISGRIIIVNIIIVKNSVTSNQILCN